MAKLKDNIELTPYGINSTPFKGEVADDVATFLIESGKAQPEDFEVLPGNEVKKINKKK